MFVITFHLRSWQANAPAQPETFEIDNATGVPIPEVGDGFSMPGMSSRVVIAKRDFSYSADATRIKLDIWITPEKPVPNLGDTIHHNFPTG